MFSKSPILETLFSFRIRRLVRRRANPGQLVEG